MPDSATISRDQLPPMLVRLLELIAWVFGLTSGRGVLELNYQDGHFEFWWQKGRGTAGDLPPLQERFEEGFDAFLGDELRS